MWARLQSLATTRRLHQYYSYGFSDTGGLSAKKEPAGAEASGFAVDAALVKSRAKVIANTSLGLMPAIAKVWATELTRERALIMAAESRGALLHARVGMLWATNHGHGRAVSDRKETHWGKRKLKRDE
jgi:hypothetical protein